MGRLSRSAIIAILFWLLFTQLVGAASAQTSTPTPNPTQISHTASQNNVKVDDLMADAKETYGHSGIAAPQTGACAAELDNAIVVCALLEDQAQFRLRNKEDAENDYAKRTMYHNDPQAPNPCFGPTCGIFTGPPTVVGLCGFGLNPCPPPPALMIDLKALPEAPPGSDADRIGRGLPPLGKEDEAPAVRPSVTGADGPP